MLITADRFINRFLKKETDLTPTETRVRHQASDIVLAGFQARLATWEDHYETNRLNFEEVLLGFLDIHKLNPRLEVIPA